MKLPLLTVIFGLSLFCLNVQAAFLDVTLTPATNIGTLNLTGSNGPLTIKYSSSAIAGKILFTNNQNTDVGNQSVDNVRSVMETQFGVNGLEDIADGSISGKVATISSVEPFSYLAIHFGQHELFFKFLTAVTDFQISIDGKAAGLSNYRAYGTPNAVPVPAAVWLFGSALAGFIGAKRKKPA